MSKHTAGPLTDGICGICGAPQAIHQFETYKCPRSGREARIGEKQIWEETTFINIDYQRLIAAAPELLEACKNAKSFLNEHKVLCNGVTPTTYMIWKKLEQAIAKAEGR